ncbi:MAG: glycoside hydrolase family 36 protein [Bacteroidota bacterium]
MTDSQALRAVLPEVVVTGVANGCNVEVESSELGAGLFQYNIKLTAPEPQLPAPITLSWRIPAHNIQGMWTPDTLYEKRLRADWELETLDASVSRNAPVICLFGHDSANVHTFACSDALHATAMRAVVREEDGFVYCHVTLFTECLAPVTSEEVLLRIDSRPQPFSTALQDVAAWWAGFADKKPAPCPPAAHDPIYSTWYSYHQRITTEALIAECEACAPLGYKTIIVDDGWQTLDSQRGYDFTGDWNPDRFPDMAEFVRKVHAIGMKCMTWYAVPFVGKKSAAYARFKDKCLTHTHRWAPVLDPRFPEVRAYLIGKYTSALKDWDLDGFKLDFIDDFRVYEDTERSQVAGRDYACIYEAVDALLTGVMEQLRAIKPDVLIEFRQRYAGPVMRKYGNMFRAFDCPHDSVTNRLRTTDVRMLIGDSAVHADMVTWHYDEPVEIAALQLWNVLFAVPQLSVRMADVPAAHRQMIKTFTEFWIAHRDVLLFGQFEVQQPLANYPLLEAHTPTHCIAGIYQSMVYPLRAGAVVTDVINATDAHRIVLDAVDGPGTYTATVFDCMGNEISHAQCHLDAGVHAFDIPTAGRLRLER